MTFLRTSKGLSNQSLFSNVDAFVYVEGGQSFSKKEIYDDKYNEASIDIQFWKGIFSIFCGKDKLKFRAIGSKSTLVQMADDIKSGKLKNVYVAMDRDFDNLVNKQIDCECVIYTYGYSWENDVWQIEVLLDFINSISAVDNNGSKVEEEIYEIVNLFYDEIKCCVYSDSYLSIKGSSFFNRKSHLRYLHFGKKIKPCINAENIERDFCEKAVDEKKVESFGDKNNIKAQKDCLGHLVSDFCYWVAVYIVNKVANVPTLAKYYFNCFGIDKFIGRLSNQHFKDVYNHYEKSFV